MILEARNLQGVGFTYMILEARNLQEFGFTYMILEARNLRVTMSHTDCYYATKHVEISSTIVIKQPLHVTLKEEEQPYNGI